MQKNISKVLWSRSSPNSKSNLGLRLRHRKYGNAEVTHAQCFPSSRKHYYSKAMDDQSVSLSRKYSYIEITSQTMHWVFLLPLFITLTLKLSVFFSRRQLRLLPATNTAVLVDRRMKFRRFGMSGIYCHCYETCIIHFLTS